MTRSLLDLLCAIKTRSEEKCILAEGSLAYEVMIVGKL